MPTHRRYQHCVAFWLAPEHQALQPKHSSVLLTAGLRLSVLQLMDCATCRFSTGGDHIRKLHDKLATYVWECFTWQGFGTAAVHYARGTDATSFAAGDTLCIRISSMPTLQQQASDSVASQEQSCCLATRTSWLTALLHHGVCLVVQSVAGGLISSIPAAGTSCLHQPGMHDGPCLHTREEGVLLLSSSAPEHLCPTAVQEVPRCRHALARNCTAP